MWMFDASSFIYAWRHYPKNQFPLFWDWLQQEIQAKRVTIANVALKEVEHRTPECREWLDQCGIHNISSNSEIARRAADIKQYLRTDYTGYGVGENDLVIISTARQMGRVLVSEEAAQPSLPDEFHNYKIPAVCKLPRVRVECIRLIDFIVNSGQVFG